MKIKFVYPVHKGLQRSFFESEGIEPIIIGGELFGIGHYQVELENAIEETRYSHLPGGPICGFDFEKLNPEIQKSVMAKAVNGVPICEDCQRIYRDLPTKENRLWDVWVR